MRYLLVIVVVLSVTLSFSMNFTKSIEVDGEDGVLFFVKWKDENLELDKEYISANDTIKFESIKFYLSNICFYRNNQVVDSAIKEYVLVDLDNPQTLAISRTNKTVFDKVTFNIGIDSITNVSGAMGGDLDPTKNMYWAWHSGYINLKIEGSSKRCPSRKNKFQFHIGGYQKPYCTLQKREILNSKCINLQIDKLFQKINIENECEIMTPNEKAVIFSKKFRDCFE